MYTDKFFEDLRRQDTFDSLLLLLFAINTKICVMQPKTDKIGSVHCSNLMQM